MIDCIIDLFFLSICLFFYPLHSPLGLPFPIRYPLADPCNCRRPFSSIQLFFPSLRTRKTTDDKRPKAWPRNAVCDQFCCATRVCLSPWRLEAREGKKNKSIRKKREEKRPVGSLRGVLLGLARAAPWPLPLACIVLLVSLFSAWSLFLAFFPAQPLTCLLLFCCTLVFSLHAFSLHGAARLRVAFSFSIWRFFFSWAAYGTMG